MSGEILNMVLGDFRSEFCTIANKYLGMAGDERIRLSLEIDLNNRVNELVKARAVLPVEAKVELRGDTMQVGWGLSKQGCEDVIRRGMMSGVLDGGKEVTIERINSLYNDKMAQVQLLRQLGY